MSHDHSALENDKARKIEQLYENLHEVLGQGFKHERFLNWIGQYLRPSREFHGLDHMLAMSELDEKISRHQGHNSAGVYSMVAGFFHDEDYPSISENITHVTKRFIDRYVEERDGKKFVKEITPDDRVGQILHGVFGFQPGQQLSPFPFKGNPGGMNEFYCAVAAACELQELGRDEHFITAIVAGIEATIPFRDPNRMDELRQRIESTNQRMGLGMTPAEIDEIMIGAVHTANKDVAGFLGGLDPNAQGVAPNTQSVLSTIAGGDRLSPEEVPPLRTQWLPKDKGPGDYTPRDFLDARIKRAGLYQLVIPGDAQERSIPNLFFETHLSGGDVYPPNDWATKANKLAYENNLPVRTAEYARLISAGMVNSLTLLCADEPQNVRVKELLHGLSDIMPIAPLPPDASQTRKLAYACLNGREQASGHDIRRSAISELILSKLDENKIEQLGKASRALLLPAPAQSADPSETRTPDEINKKNAQTFLELATEYLGQSVGKIRDDIARSAGKGEGTKALATRIREFTLPPVQAVA